MTSFANGLSVRRPLNGSRDLVLRGPFFHKVVPERLVPARAERHPTPVVGIAGPERPELGPGLTSRDLRLRHLHAHHVALLAPHLLRAAAGETGHAVQPQGDR